MQSMLLSFIVPTCAGGGSPIGRKLHSEAATDRNASQPASASDTELSTSFRVTHLEQMPFPPTLSLPTELPPLAEQRQRVAVAAPTMSSQVRQHSNCWLHYCRNSLRLIIIASG